MLTSLLIVNQKLRLQSETQQRVTVSHDGKFINNKK